jgi:tetratricopeptide (TPR) repeat protein
MTENRYQQRLSPGSAAAQGPHSTATVNNFYGARPYSIDEIPVLGSPDLQWLMAQPSRLLDARSRVVDFIGRHAELRRLEQWRDSDETRLSVLLLHGLGGQGKTRLAAEFAERSRSTELPAGQRWHVLRARLPGGPIGSASPPATDHAGILLVVDYADRWAHSDLARLFYDPVLHQPLPVRVLLIARTVRWYAAMRGELNERRVPAEDLLLLSLTSDRLAVFAAARDRYARPDLYDLPDPSSVQVSGSLDNPDFGLTLTLHAAALVAVDAHARGRRPPNSPHELSAYLLDREYQAWQRLFDAGQHGQDYQTRPSVMARTVFTATLTGAVGHDTGIQALRTLEFSGQLQEILLDHRFCYPPIDREQVLEPLYPDRLAEDFLALLVPGHEVTGYDPDPWSQGVPAALLTAGNGLRPALAPRVLTFLAAATDRWPHLGDKVLYPLLATDPTLVLDGSSAALTALAGIKDLNVTALEGVAEAIKDRAAYTRQVDLDVGIAAITQRLTEHRLATSEDPADRAYLYVSLGWRLANAGHHQEAIEAAEQAVAIYRQHAGTDPDMHLPGLVVALNHISVWWSELGQRARALAAAQEAAGVATRLARADRSALLARSFGNLGIRLIETDQPRQALTAFRKAIRLGRRLARKALRGRVVADADDINHLVELAGALQGLGTVLGRLGKPKRGLAAIQESIVIHRRLSKTDPGAHLPNLALTLISLGIRMLELGWAEQAVAALEEAVAIHRQLAEVNPDAHLRNLAIALCALAGALAQLGQPSLVLPVTLEAVDLSCRLLETTPVVVQPLLTRLVFILAESLMALGQPERALPVLEEIEVRYRRLAAVDPNDHVPHLAELLGVSSALLAVQHRLAPALAATAEAAALYRGLAEANPAAHQPGLARALYVYALMRVGENVELPEARRAATDSIAIYRQLAQRRPEVFTVELRAAEFVLAAFATEPETNSSTVD